ncbi:MAG: NAD(P)-dependent oxidoreductase, partial [Myxococcota bacterium]
KSETDKYVAEMASKDFTTVSLRAATVCGWSPRMRLDLTVNILTTHAVTRGQITVHGGQQMRPNIVIDDLIEAYATLLEAPADRVNGRAYNVGGDNYSVLDIAKIVASSVAPDAKVVVESVVDRRSYHVSSQRIRDELGFVPKFDISYAAGKVAEALRDGRISDPEQSRYRNLAHMKAQGFH